MAIALHTADRAAQLYLGGANATLYHAELRRQFEHRLSFASMFSRLVIAIPSLAQVVRVWPSLLSGIFTTTRLPGAQYGT